ncbi:hypothetical protein ACFWB2_44630 [Streptomyces virginiae]|uniref:hypothetical protein n=1 Tax=Streptomyces virginiae TaxID=1961 RepID=UPI00369AA550
MLTSTASAIRLFEIVDLLGQVPDPAGQQPQGVASGPGRPAHVLGIEVGAPFEQVRVARPGKRLAEARFG